ncbi:M10 family metallopeptidase [Paracoccus hibiscisoli]|uniref:Matrixin family metalloprotease n=1 Tax=Paracoccus hibiscisoli TaxID=2023261 RepID=A0A4U0QVH1_9RHOB|nr:M10 family metallopeptidase [Paracoccus hibiscisoli]TJZ86181.1 matrixin family metalloprotease [Paracoccus hibiscisoli]
MCTICAAIRPFDPSCALSGLAGTGIDSLRAVIRETADAAPRQGTAYRMAVGDSFVGAIDGRCDEDWVGIALEAGRSYVFELRGAGRSPLLDPVVELYSPQGGFLRFVDNEGQGLNSRMVFTAPQSGTYYLSVEGHHNSIGGFQLTAQVLQPLRPASLDTMATYLTRGYWIDKGLVPRAYDVRTDNIITVDLSGLGPAGQAMARSALQAWAAVADLQFRETTTRAEIRFTENDRGAYAGATMTLDGRVVSSVLNIDRGWHQSEGNRIGTYTFQTYLHEIGHALGLGHMGPYNGGGTFPGDARFANDSWQASVMSYFAQTRNPNIDASYAFAATLMPADIIAIQRLYGAAGAGTLTAGNTVYGLGHTLGDSWLGRIFAAQNGAQLPGIEDARDVAMTIYDAGGFDTINFSRDGMDQRVDLRMGASSDVWGLRGNLQIAPGTLIEGYVAGSGNDVVQGNAVGNMLRGGAGNDRILGNGGNDSLHGGMGNDTLIGGAGNDRLFGNEGADHLTDMLGNNWMAGGMGNDRLTAGAGRDTLYGDMGNDIILAGAGDDLVFGGPGWDTIRAGAGNDRAEGGMGNDLLDGGPGRDTLLGQQGNDTIIGGLGQDVLTGGMGADVFRFNSVADSARGLADLITDFRPGEDMIDLRALNLTFAGTGPHDGMRSLRWDHMDGATRLLVDVNGDRTPDMIIRLAGRLELEADHFLL